LEITSDVEPYFEFCLEMECAAAEPYLRFVYDDFAKGLAVERFLGEKRLLESSPPYGFVLLEDGEPVGMVSAAPGPELRRLRMRAAFALRKSDALQPNADEQRRIQLAHQALFMPEDTDYYAGKLGVSPDIRSRGASAMLMMHINEQVVARGFARAIAEVEPSNKAMLWVLTDKVGWKILRTPGVEDPATGRSLRYVHLCWDRPQG